MKIIRQASEDEMISNFLMGEICSNRFSEKLKKVLDDLYLNKSIIENPNLDSEKENLQRKKILQEFRGYGKNEGLFENFPNIKKYTLCSFSFKDLKNISYINYSYWNELSNSISSPLVAAENIKKNKVVFNVSNKQYFDCAKEIEQGKTFAPMIFLTCDYKKFVILEGHLRITSYSLVPNYFNNIKCFVLECSKKELERWNG